MTQRRRIEIFTAGCGVCDEAVSRVRRLACDSCEIVVRDMADPTNAARAYDLGVRSLPAVAVEDRLAACCAGHGLDEATLRAAGLGQPIG